MQPVNVESLFAVGSNFDYSMFQIAIAYAENGLGVWYIIPEAYDRVPKNIKPPNKEVLQLITFMYLKDYTDLITHLNAIHLWHKIPHVIIVTKFESYSGFNLPNYDALKAAQIITCLLDSAAVCARKHSDKVKLIVTCEKPSETDLKTLQVIRDLYFMSHLYKEDDDEFIESILGDLKQSDCNTVVKV